MSKLIAVVLVIVSAVGLMLGFSALFALPTMWAINYVFSPTALAAVFGVAQINFLKTWLLMSVCGILFKSSVTSRKSK